VLLALQVSDFFDLAALRQVLPVLSTAEVRVVTHAPNAHSQITDHRSSAPSNTY
jgi:hypothetical protein